MTGSWKAIQRNIRRYLPWSTPRSSSPRVDQPTVHNDSIFERQISPPLLFPPQNNGDRPRPGDPPIAIPKCGVFS